MNVLEVHASDVLKYCLCEAGELCAFYLRMMPWKLGKRHLVARLAICLAKELETGSEEGRYFLGDGARNTLEALLRAGAEYPDDVCSLARLFAQRVPSPKDDEEIKVVSSTGLFSGQFGRLLDPWPDGPRCRVAEPFRDAVLIGDSLLALMKFRPALAEELILAVCIEEPQREGESHSLERPWVRLVAPIYASSILHRSIPQVPST